MAARIEWIRRQWNEPTRSDHYLMLIATRIQQVLHKHPNQVKLDDQRIKFGKPKPDKPKTPEQRATFSQWAKGIWRARVNKALAWRKQQQERRRRPTK